MGIRVRCTFSKDDDGDAEQKRYLRYYDGWCGDNEDKDGFGFLVLMLSRCCGSVATTPMMKTVTDDNVHDKSKVEDNGWLAN